MFKNVYLERSNFSKVKLKLKQNWGKKNVYLKRSKFFT